MATKTMVESIAWAGSDPDETLLDVLAIITNLAPSAKFRLIEAYPSHTGGWPVFEIEYDEADQEGLDRFIDEF